MIFRTAPAQLDGWLRRIDQWIAYANSVVEVLRMPSMRPRTTPMWVIFAGSPDARGSSVRYVTDHGGITAYKQEARKFSTATAARDFASEQGITLDGVARHVGQELFTQAEIDWRPFGS